MAARTPRVRVFCARRIRQEESTVRAHTAVLFVGLVSVSSFAQSVEKEPAAVVELGGAAGRSLTEGQSNFGPTVAVEVTPIANKLELEAGITPLFRRHSTEWSIDVLFKKPWTISETKEFMLGIGPRMDSHKRIRSQNELDCC